jgi:cytochrome P450
MVFAGHETTANTLSWLLYLVSADNAVYTKLLDSIAEKPIEASLSNEYLKAVIHEAMRLYPPAWMTDRVALADDEFDGFSFPKNTIIILFLYGLHHDKEHWKDNALFRPERFIEDAGLVRSKNFLPFGAGPRMCIGNNFAMMEMVFFLQLFLKEFTVKPAGQVPQMRPVLTLRPDKVMLNIVKIKA